MENILVIMVMRMIMINPKMYFPPRLTGMVIMMMMVAVMMMILIQKM